jgi:hypothetical protein
MRKIGLVLASLVLTAASPPDVAGIISSMQVTSKAELVSPGKGALQRLTYAPKPGATATVQSTVSTSVGVTVLAPDGSKVSAPTQATPDVVTKMAYDVDDPASTGFVVVHVTPIDMKLRGGTAAVRDQVSGTLDDLAATTFDILVDPTGVPSQVDVHGDSDLADGMQGLIDQLQADLGSFPRQAVGRGAKWTITSRVAMDGFAAVVTQACRLTDQDADTIGYTCDFDLTRDTTVPLALPGVPAGVGIEVRKFGGHGTGQQRVDRHTLAITGGSDMDMEIDMSVTAKGQSTSMTMTMHQKTTRVKVD